MSTRPNSSVARAHDLVGGVVQLDVDGDGERPRAGLLDRGGAVAQRVLVTTAEHDVAAFGAQVGGHLPADALARAGHDRDAVAQAEVHCDQPSAAIRSA